MGKSTIEWTEFTWNPVTGCDKVSQGCKNCYAGRLAETRLKHLPYYQKGFYGNVVCHEDRLNEPLKLKKPHRIFVNSMSDLFHEDVPTKFILNIFETMASVTAECRHRRLQDHEEECWTGDPHIFQILTKRPERMMNVINKELPNMIGDLMGQWTLKTVTEVGGWPLPNVWLGVSVEDQKTADERIPWLLETKAAKRFVSYEPALGPVDFTKIMYRDGDLTTCLPPGHLGLSDWAVLDWVIAGGESGPQSRPSHPDWFRSVQDQCAAAGVPFFFKQWGEWGYLQNPTGLARASEGYGYWDHRGEFHPRAFESGGMHMHKMGKAAAGSLLDGREWKEYPE